MKLYRFTCFRDKVEVSDFEVEEKPKSYKNVGIGYFSLIKKSEIDCLRNGYGLIMFSLSPSKTKYLEKVIELTNKKINRLSQDLETLKAKKESFYKLYKEELEREKETK